MLSLVECLAAERSIVKQTPVAAASRIAGRRTRLTDFPSELAVSPIRALRRRNSIPFKDEMRQKTTPGIEQCSTARRWNCELGKELPSKHVTINRDRSRSLYQQHVVALFDVVNTNLRIFSDFRGFDHSPI
jgi:hypothetical protein